MEGKKHYLEEEKTDLSEALDRQRHIFESKVNVSNQMFSNKNVSPAVYSIMCSIPVHDALKNHEVNIFSLHVHVRNRKHLPCFHKVMVHAT